MNTPFQDMHDENMKINVCEHGNSHHCQSCEVKQLKYVIEEQQKEIESLKKYKKVLMENSIVRSKAIEAYEDAIRDAVSIAEAQGEDFRLEPWCTLRDMLEDKFIMDKDGNLTLNQSKCVMCEITINLWFHNTFEYDDEGNAWCDKCFERESDTGETY